MNGLRLFERAARSFFFMDDIALAYSSASISILVAASSASHCRFSMFLPFGSGSKGNTKLPSSITSYTRAARSASSPSASSNSSIVHR